MKLTTYVTRIPTQGFFHHRTVFLRQVWLSLRSRWDLMGKTWRGSLASSSWYYHSCKCAALNSLHRVFKHITHCFPLDNDLSRHLTLCFAVYEAISNKTFGVAKNPVGVPSVQVNRARTYMEVPHPELSTAPNNWVSEQVVWEVEGPCETSLIYLLQCPVNFCLCKQADRIAWSKHQQLSLTVTVLTHPELIYQNYSW